jgi:hypothetical protein
MKPTVREHIQQLDVSKGGGIVSDKIRVDTIDHPMLVIGLGGTGIDAMLRLKYQVNRRFKLPEDPFSKKRKEKPDNIEFLAFETNDNDRTKKYEGIGLDPLTEFVSLSNSELASVLHNRSLLEPYIREWLSPELNITDGKNGASGIRQAGRLLMFTKINQVVQNIQRKIQTLMEGADKNLIVYILSGLSGGTGSGSFLDIAYIVRGILGDLHDVRAADKVELLGYLFMPDVNLSNKSLTEHTREYIRKNGYAALKELDYWMNIDERGDVFRQQYGSILNVQSKMPPFTYAHLVSATNVDGKQLENGYDYCMNVVAENIANFMASEEKQSGQEFAIHDYMSNITMNIKNMKTPYPANYKYNILGASSAVLPIEEITTYLGFKVFQRMEKMFHNAPSQSDTDNLAHRLGLDPDSVSRQFNGQVYHDPLTGYQNSERYSYANVVRQQNVSMDTELEQFFLAQAREQYIKVRRQLPAQIKGVFEEQMNKIFRNPEQGPFFASRIIFSDKGFCLLQLILSYIESLRERLHRIPREIEGARSHASGKMADARSALISKDRKKDDYIKAKIEEYRLRSDKDRMERMIEFYEDVYNQISEENSRLYEVFTELLNELNKIFQKNADILVNGEEEVDIKGNKTYYWKVVKVPDVAKEIGKVLEDKNVDQLIRGFTESLMENSNLWIREQEVDILTCISEFLSEQFGDLITRSMEDYLLLKYGETDALDRLVETKIAARLHSESSPVFYLNNPSGAFNFPSCGFVSVPAQASNIFKGVKNYEKNSTGDARFTIKESNLKNRIFWLTTKNGIPLYLYTPIRGYEESYERTILEPEGVGRHLVQTDKVSWVNLPSPIPEKAWGELYENHRVKKNNAELRSLFAEAFKFGCIRMKPEESGATSRYECVFTKPLHLDEFVSGYSLQLQAARPNFGEIKRCITDLNALLNNGIPVAERKDIFGSVDEECARDNFIRSPELSRRVRDELARFRSISERIEELEKFMAGQQDEERLVQLFFESMYTGAIRRKGVAFVYDHDDNEEPWEPFVNLLQVNKFAEYEIYNKLRQLDGRKNDLLKRKVEKRLNQLTSSSDVTPLVTSLRECAASYTEARTNLELNKDDFMNGDELYRFYRQISGKAQDLLNTIK